MIWSYFGSVTFSIFFDTVILDLQLLKMKIRSPLAEQPPLVDNFLQTFRPEKDYLQDLELPSPTAGLQEESTLPVSPLSDRSFGIFGFLPPQGNSSRHGQGNFSS